MRKCCAGDAALDSWYSCSPSPGGRLHRFRRQLAELGAPGAEVVEGGAWRAACGGRGWSEHEVLSLAGHGANGINSVYVFGEEIYEVYDSETFNIDGLLEVTPACLELAESEESGDILVAVVCQEEEAEQHAGELVVAKCCPHGSVLATNHSACEEGADRGHLPPRSDLNLLIL